MHLLMSSVALRASGWTAVCLMCLAPPTLDAPSLAATSQCDFNGTTPAAVACQVSLDQFPLLQGGVVATTETPRHDIFVLFDHQLGSRLAKDTATMATWTTKLFNRLARSGYQPSRVYVCFLTSSNKKELLFWAAADGPGRAAKVNTPLPLTPDPCDEGLQ